MRNDILHQALSELESLRNNNHLEEEKRRIEAIEACPEIATVLDRRRSIISDGIRNILKGDRKFDIEGQMVVQNLRLKELLTSINKPVDWLEPIYKCKECKDTGYVGDTIRNECHCLIERYNQLLSSEALSSYTSDASFDQFDLNLFSDDAITSSGQTQRKVMDHAFTVCQAWSTIWPDEKKNTVLLQGASGLGKTYLMHCMARKMIERGFRVSFLSAFRFFEIARHCHKTTETEEFDDLLASDVVMIDDIGSEPMMNNITIVYLYNLIDQRQSTNKATVISTNLTIGELSTQYSERISSRLTDKRLSHIVLLTGEDIRKRK